MKTVNKIIQPVDGAPGAVGEFNYQNCIVAPNGTQFLFRLDVSELEAIEFMMESGFKDLFNFDFLNHHVWLNGNAWYMIHRSNGQVVQEGGSKSMLLCKLHRTAYLVEGKPGFNIIVHCPEENKTATFKADGIEIVIEFFTEKDNFNTWNHDSVVGLTDISQYRIIAERQ